MRRFTSPATAQVHWFSADSDWNNKDVHSIVIWRRCILKEADYDAFKEFAMNDLLTDAEPIGTFYRDGIANAVFLAKTNLAKFSVKKIACEGMIWWYDYFAEQNGGKIIENEVLLAIIEKLGLKVIDIDYLPIED